VEGLDDIERGTEREMKSDGMGRRKTESGIIERMLRNFNTSSKEKTTNRNL
jgi:hypothetical protein